jgi:hypothetical protein
MTATTTPRRGSGQRSDSVFSRATARKIVAAVAERALQGDPEAAEFILRMGGHLAESEAVPIPVEQDAEPDR